jgi:oligoendopeptidase F
MPQRDYDDLDFPKSGGIWQGQLHIYRFPFYYIDYTLAQTCAFQFWINNQNDKEESWQNYLKLCEAGGSLSFTSLIKLAGLRSPFVDGCLEDVVSNIKEWLDNIDLKKL